MDLESPTRTQAMAARQATDPEDPTRNLVTDLDLNHPAGTQAIDLEGPKRAWAMTPIPSYRDGGPKKDSGYGPGRSPKNPGYGPGRSDKDPEFDSTPGYGSGGPSKDPGYGHRVPTKKPGNDRTPGYGPRRPSKDTDSGRRRPTNKPDIYRARPYKAPQFGSKGPGYVGPSVGYRPPQLRFPFNFGKKDLDDLDKIYFRLDGMFVSLFLCCVFCLFVFSILLVLDAKGDEMFWLHLNNL